MQVRVEPASGFTESKRSVSRAIWVCEACNLSTRDIETPAGTPCAGPLCIEAATVTDAGAGILALRRKHDALVAVARIADGLCDTVESLAAELRAVTRLNRVLAHGGGPRARHRASAWTAAEMYLSRSVYSGVQDSTVDTA
jgi:hypothetical protein